ncbi:MAG: hypothetical protein ACE366_26140 [Bradymonadia bacterium]
MFGFGNKVKIPSHLKDRLATVARDHQFKGADDFAMHLIDKGLVQLGDPDPQAKLKDRLEAVVDLKGYADREELVEHLLDRGLRAYSEPAESREKLEARLRGLGYIE